jgi:ATP-binding cassette subfamily B protein
VVQTSAMDCGPAALKCLLEGFGVSASYGRLREACQTDVDGTSIDTLEEIARRVGLDAEQVMLPVDHVLLDEAAALPAIVIVRAPSGFTHFVVAWRRHGSMVQVMDPASGRRWMSRERFLQDLFIHETRIPAGALREWIESDDFRVPLERRMANLGVGAKARAALVESARQAGWEASARLDAAVRMVAAMLEGGGVRAGSEAERVIAAAVQSADAIAVRYFTARPDNPGPDGEPQVKLRGAVLVRVSGLKDTKGEAPASPELTRALTESRESPMRGLFALVREGGWLTPGVLLFAIALASVGAVVEAVLLRAALDLPRSLGTVQQRLVAVGALVAFVTAVRAVDGPVATETLRIGRQLEMRLRCAFLEKLPRLGDRYFQSRPISDMAERAHTIHKVRELPELGGRALRAAAELVVTTAAIVWLDPRSAAVAVAACAAAVVVPLAWQPALIERDLRVRSHSGALTRLSFDALLGLMPVRTHAAETSVRREHEGLLVEWARASRDLVRASAWADAVQSLATIVAVAWMVFGYVQRRPDTSGVLLLAYWGLQLPTLGEELGLLLRQYPGQRNVTLRLLEPLGAMEEQAPARDSTALEAHDAGVAIELDRVGVVVAGHAVLRGVTARIAAGEHVAVVGASGAGKSSLAGVLLGWHRVSEGSVRVDGAPLAGAALDELRTRTAWVDPSVQIWNRSLLDNLRYGASPGADSRLGPIFEGANIQPLLERLPDGLQTSLGEGGALVSGGEGQRVRLGRAMLRQSAKLVIFDEAFRGLDRNRRRELLTHARTWWNRATFLCITHDIGETLDFERVLVIEGGRVVEDGAPRQLALEPDSRFGAMLRSERALLGTTWGGADWRRLRITRGTLATDPKPSRASAMQSQETS